MVCGGPAKLNQKVRFLTDSVKQQIFFIYFILIYFILFYFILPLLLLFSYLLLPSCILSFPLLSFYLLYSTGIPLFSYLLYSFSISILYSYLLFFSLPRSSPSRSHYPSTQVYLFFFLKHTGLPIFFPQFQRLTGEGRQ